MAVPDLTDLPGGFPSSSRKRPALLDTVVAEAGGLAVVAPLGEVVRLAYRHHARESGHRVAEAASKVVACFNA